MKKESHQMISYHSRKKAPSPQNNQLLYSTDLLENSDNEESFQNTTNQMNKKYFQSSNKLEESLLKLNQQLLKPLPFNFDNAYHNKLLKQENQRLKEQMKQLQERTARYSNNDDMKKMMKKVEKLTASNEFIKKEIHQCKAQPKPELKYEMEFFVKNMVGSMKKLIMILDNPKDIQNDYYDDDDLN